MDVNKSQFSVGLSTFSQLSCFNKGANFNKVFFWSLIVIITLICYIGVIRDAEVTRMPSQNSGKSLVITAYKQLRRIGSMLPTIIPKEDVKVEGVSYENATNPSTLPETAEEHQPTFTSMIPKRKYPYPLFPRQPKRLDHSFPKEILTEAEFNSTERKKLKKIIFWTDSYGEMFWGLGYGQAPFLIGECKYSNCFTTAKRDRFDASEVDAILWHFRATDKRLPNARFPNARYIFFMAESASHLYGSITPYNHVFDLTFTYRTDSDIPDPYSIVAQRESIEEKYTTGDFSAGKNKMAAWFVSNCHTISERNTLVETLKKYITVDVYGKCGSKQCPRKTTTSCYNMAAKSYFFYLSFENSLCKDYITEKFFNILGHDIVPVVYGYGPYWKHAPPHSYIDAFDFPSVKKLAQYLTHLSQTPYEYNEYFRWKAYYIVLPMYTRRLFSLCKICEILNTQSTANATRYNLEEWFVRKSDCKNGGQSEPIKNFIRGENLTKSFNELRFSGDNSKPVVPKI